ncbi:MAG: DUF1816 domain-containing protein [Pleurocapsa sp. MO_192.B19]|nr:DUF1816 domain-containing protein [Pleurocapsa sp. MO_192.B19]
MIFNKLTRLKSPLRLRWIKQSQLSWWLEIKTAKPYYIYYFGPFVSPKEARLYQAGYVEDLVKEEAEVIAIKLKKCHPLKLTICHESELD